MLETILSIATSGGFGALTGLAGGYLQKKHELKVAELNLEADKFNREKDLQELQIENTQVLAIEDKKIDVAEAETAMAVSKTDAETFGASIKNQAVQTGIRFVDGVRGLMRPLITTYLLVLATAVTWHLHGLSGGIEGSMTAAEISALYIHIIHQLIFLTVTAVSWWFASRGKTI